MILLLLAALAQEEIRLLVRSDDMGVAQAVNEGCVRSCVDGLARSVEVIVPGPWYPQAVRMLKERPEIDVGLHLCLTSEWEEVKWRPLTHAPSLVDAGGHFFPTTRQRKDFPPDTGFLEAGPKPEEVERELRAQIEKLKRDLPRLSHMSSHMGTAVSTPELKALVQKLGAEYGLAVETSNIKPVRGWSGARKSGEQKEADLVDVLQKLEAGTWLIVEHPALDSPESRAMGHRGYTNVAEDRAGVLRALTSPRAKEVVKTRGIKLISYADLK
ncbi:MAG TPA: ChbG/HpnK family deacetylase [Planctomycetota bacterium]